MRSRSHDPDSTCTRRFEEWYAAEVTKQLQDVELDIEEIESIPVDLSFARVKELSAQWLVDMVEYISDNPNIVVNGFLRSEITPALDGLREDASNEDDIDDDEFDEDEFGEEDYENDLDC